MAVTSIWPIKGRVDKVINYARNPEKTHDKKSLLKLHEIEGVIEYAADEMKTETRALVTCLNLSSEENAAKEFMEVKHRYGKEDGRVCYHGYQSFKADEVDADTAHNIGVALAKELWGDRFQVVIATHCNTGHYHNHFVINSVSDVDGLKFYNSPEDYRHMREVSDRLCREARISVIDHPDGKKKNYGEWVAEKNGKPTVRDTIRADIDRAILASTTERDFISVMEEMGYKIETKTETGAPRQHPIVILHGKKHFRLDKLGEFYELESIKQRIQNNIRKRVPFPEVKEDKKAPYYHYKEKAQKATGLYALYLYYCYELHITAQNKNTVRQRKSAHQQSTVRETASTGGEVRKNAVRGKRNQTIKTAERTEHTIKQSARSAGKKTVKTGAKGTVKSSEKAIKTAEKTSKAAIKTAERTAKATQKAAQATAKAAQKAAEMARQAAIAAYKAAVAAAKAIAAAIKAIAAAIKELIAAIAAGGWVAVVVIIVICLIGLIVASCFGIFFSSEDTGSTQTMQQVVQEINLDYQNKLDDIKNSNTYDELEMSGSRAVWPEVLSIYAVKTTNDPDNPQEVASMTDEKKQLLKDIFWEMNEISYETEEKTETVIIETDDGEGNIIEEEVEETTVYLYITVSHKTVEEMMAQYGFAEDQKVQVAELLAQDSSMWASVLYGIYGADDQIVAVALSQLGNVGGEPYWSWYGFGSRVEWCACFVSWCADQCGYIETGVIPKYAGCVNGVNWFKDRGQWADNDIEPAPGMIIFFDWDNKGSSGPQDGESDHTGIVERVEDGIVYTVEGNSGDSCRENHYAVGYYEILGYGIPAY